MCYNKLEKFKRGDGSMNLVEFFGTVIKPKKVKGKGMMSPLETGWLDEELGYVRDKDVNAFFIRTKNGYIAIDSGYKNSENMKKGMENLGIQPRKVHSLFLTHLDLDHAGGVDKYCFNIFPTAEVYLGKEEEKYLIEIYSRKKIAGIKLASPISLREGYKTLDDGSITEIDGVKIRSFLTPGHTLGHTSYLIGDRLFTGDTLILGDDGGYCFWDFWNTDSDMNKASLDRLYEIAKANDVKYIITSHNGLCDNIEKAFLHRDTYINWRKKGFVFRKDAPFDPYR